MQLAGFASLSPSPSPSRSRSSSGWFCSCGQTMAILVVLLIAATRISALDVLPTAIVRQPSDNDQRYREGMVYGNRLYVHEGSTLELPCVASGTQEAAPTYYWTFNGQRFNSPLVFDQVSVASYSTRTGTLQFTRFEPRFTGSYQCYAANGPDNQFVAVSDVVNLAMVILPRTFGEEAERDTPALIGEYRKFTCDIKSAGFDPPALVKWTDADSTLVDSNRLVMDASGDLHIVAVTPDGPETRSRLRCRVIHKASGVEVKDKCSSRILLQNTTSAVQQSAPQLVYPPREKLTYTFVEGDPAQVMCIFSGYPVPSINFLSASTGDRLDPSTDAQRRISIKGGTLKWSTISRDDAGTYMCSASNLLDRSDVSFRVIVKVRPSFTSPVLKTTRGFNVTAGDDLTIDCSTEADPPATVSWSINGVKANEIPAGMPFRDRITFYGDGARYALLRAAKTDNHVVQCNASNAYGYVYGSFYVNVLNRTVITKRPENQTLDLNSTFASGSCSLSLSCIATTDKMNLKDNTFRVTWFKSPLLPFGSSDFVPLNLTDRAREPRLMQTVTGLCFNVEQYSVEERVNELAGAYKCRAENGVSVDEAVAYIQFSHGEMRQVEAGNRSANGTLLVVSDIQTSTAGFSLWIIFVVIGLLLLIVVIAMIWLSVYRRRGGSYLVDQQERAQGNDPEKEMKRDGFADYIRPDQDPKKGSSASMESVKMAYDEEEESLDEFADIDHTKFGEDGSFIGQYANSRPGKRDRDAAANEERERFANSYSYA